MRKPSCHRFRGPATSSCQAVTRRGALRPDHRAAGPRGRSTAAGGPGADAAINRSRSGWTEASVNGVPGQRQPVRQIIRASP